MTRFVAALLLAVFASFAGGASPDPKDLAIPPQELSKARELIKRLGSEIYREREEAHAELAKMGRLARPALVEAAASDADPEVRYRCSRLLPKAGADDLKARLDTFLADTESKYEHELPGLKQFRKHVGTDEKARALFVEAVKSPYNVELLQAIDKNATEAGRAISDRRTHSVEPDPATLRQRPAARSAAQIELPDIAILLFAESITPAKEIPRTGIWSYVTGVNFLQQNSAMQVLNGNNNPAHAESFKKIVAQWMESRDDPNDLNQLSYIAGQTLKNLPQSIPLLRKIINHESTYGYAKGQALMHLTQQKGKEELPFLQKLITNDTQVQIVWFGQNGNQAIQHQCLLKDVAFAYIVTLHGHNMTDFGFKYPPGAVPQPNQIGYGNFAFESDDARRLGMVKWGFMRFKHGPNRRPAEEGDFGTEEGHRAAPATSRPTRNRPGSQISHSRRACSQRTGSKCPLESLAPRAPRTSPRTPPRSPRGPRRGSVPASSTRPPTTKRQPESISVRRAESRSAVPP